MRLRLYKRRVFQKKGCRRMCLLVIFAALVVALYLFFERIYPNYMARLDIFAENLAVRMINATLPEAIRASDGKFSDITFGENGTVSSIEENTNQMNLFKSEYVRLLQDKINNMPAGYVSIPLGSLLSKEIFSGMGPEIKIKTVPYAVVRADFKESFVSCGINQVKHKIYLEAEVKITMVSATMRKTKTVKECVPVSETVIGGTVPRYYGRMGLAAENDS